MASSLRFKLLFSFLLFSISIAKATRAPDALLLPIMKDVETLQYVTEINSETPQHSPMKLVVDLGGQFLWVACESRRLSSSYRLLPPRSIPCSTAAGSSTTNKKSCSLFTKNTVTKMSINGELAQDIISIPSIQSGYFSTGAHFLFSCTPTFLLQGLSSGARGLAGLGRSRIALPSQLAGLFAFDRKFTMCLPSSTSLLSKGFLVFGGGNEFSKSLMYTPLIINDAHHEEYFIGVKSIKINGERISLNTSLLSIDNQGVGGTKLSTSVPYTTLESSIYNAFINAFMKASISFNITRAASVVPFDVCFSSRSIVGSAVPSIDLVLQSDMVKWRIHGTNSMVRVSKDVFCLGFLDGGLNTRTSIVVGGHQMENTLLQFDLASLRMGFTSLLDKHVDCSILNSHPEFRVSS